MKKQLQEEKTKEVVTKAVSVMILYVKILPNLFKDIEKLEVSDIVKDTLRWAVLASFSMYLTGDIDG